MATSDYIQALIRKSKLNFTDEYPEPPVVLRVHNRIFGTLGNFSVVTGQAKSKKTFSVSLAIAAALKNAGTGTISSHFPKDKNRVILFDTEQSRFHVHKHVKRICTLIGEDTPENFDVYCLREVSTRDRMEVIREVVHSSKDVGLVVIDGIRDLVSSINSEEEATLIADFLLQMTGKKNIHVITVLHQNKGSETVRGHIGSELQNKAETVAVVTKDKDSNDSSTFRADVTRNQEFDGFQFYINQDGLPIINDEVVLKKTKNDTKKATPDEIKVELHNQIIAQLKPTKQYSRTELKKSLQTIINRVVGEHFGEKKIDPFINYYLNNQMLVKEGTDGTRNVRYSAKQSQP